MIVRAIAVRGLLAPVLALLLALLPIAPLSAQTLEPPYWQRFDVRIDVQQNGDFLLSENQTVLFGPTPAREGFREIPLDRVVRIADVSVAEPGIPYREGAGAPYTFHVERDEGVLRIVWRFPPTSDAARTFVVGYRVIGGLRYHPEGDQLHWKAVYSDRPYPIESASVVVRFPFDLQAEQVKTAAYPESLGAGGRLVDPRTVRFDARAVPAGTGVEARVQFPHGQVAGGPPPWQEAADRADQYDQTLRPVLNLFAGALGLLVLLVGSLWVFLTWYSRGRDPAVGEVPEMLTEPPEELPPGVAGSLVDEQADTQDVIATLVDLARRGTLRIIQVGTPMPGGSREDFRLELRNRRPEGLRGYERTILDALFAEGDTARFSRLGRRFQGAVPSVQEQLYQEVVRAGFFPASPRAVRRRQTALGLGLLAIGAGLALWLAGSLGSYVELIWAPFVALALVGAEKAAVARRMPARTQVGALAAARWRAFARYLAGSGPREASGAQPEVFDRYLPYAIALGADREWVRKFAAAGAPAPSWYEVEPPPMVVLPGMGPTGPWGGWDSLGIPPGDRRPAGPPLSPPNLEGLSNLGAWNLQNLSDSMARTLDQVSDVLAGGGNRRGGWGGGGWGGGGWSGGGGFGGGGGGGGSGGFR